jgi:hypothetical protein
MITAARSSAALAAMVLVACGGPKQEAPVGVSLPDTKAPVTFAFDSLDSRPVSSAAMLGKPGVLLFVTTWDALSQAEVGYVVAVAGDEQKQASFALVALQEPSARELVEIYRDTMKVTFPVALGDPGTIAGGGTLGDVHQVPTIVLLDPEGRVAWRYAGLVKPDELRARLKRLER